MNTIEKESLDKTGLRSDVVTLYHGGLYHLYRYKKYTDVRLVFAPEQDIAFFGGDPDNFEYPRYDLDICFFRVYENGKPAKIEHYPASGATPAPSDGELVFVVRAPGPDRPAEHGGAPGVPPRPRAARDARPALPPRGAAADLQRAERRERPAGARTTCSAYQNSRKARLGRTGRACRTRRSWTRSGPRRRRSATAVAARPEARKPMRRRLGRGRQGRSQPGTTIYTTTMLLEQGAGLQQRAVPHRPDAGAPGRGRPPSPTPSGCASTASRTCESLEQELFSEAPIYDDLETSSWPIR